MRLSFILSFGICLVNSALLLPEVAKATVRVCNGSIGAIIVESLRVNKDQFCRLKGTTIQGNLLIDTNATLVASEVTITGNIQAKNSAQINVNFFSKIDGSIQIQESQIANISASKIHGNVHIKSTFGNVSILGNEIKGNLEVIQNDGQILIRNNRITGDLICQGNQLNPSGNDNIVRGSKENQCTNL